MQGARGSTGDLLKWRKADKLDHLSELRKVLQHVSMMVTDGCHSKYLNRVLHLLQTVTHRIGLMNHRKDGISDGGLVQKVIDRHVDNTIG